MLPGRADSTVSDVVASHLFMYGGRQYDPVVLISRLNRSQLSPVKPDSHTHVLLLPASRLPLPLHSAELAGTLYGTTRGVTSLPDSSTKLLPLLASTHSYGKPSTRSTHPVAQSSCVLHGTSVL